MSEGSPALERLLRDARYYVSVFEPRDDAEVGEQEAMLREIDDALPPAVIEAVCADAYCCLPDGHEGACDDLPF
jgi:hypothetical protein